ncbi:MAG: hypothetical protein JWM76_3911 [Pseudonocardiales bacterium]|nr:hypothetical protein [Pseudonocardiales bacterium]
MGADSTVWQQFELGCTSTAARCASPAACTYAELRSRLGLNDMGTVGVGTTGIARSPVALTALANVTSLAGGRQAGYATTADGHAWAWGVNGDGELGTGTTSVTT